MKTTLQLAFVIPTLLVMTVAALAPTRASHAAKPAASASAEPIRYVTLDRMIRSFASQAHAERERTGSTILAQR